MKTVDTPTVLIIAGNDPSGGAGIAADLAACARLGCHGAPVISSLTVQDTRNVYSAQAVSTDLLIQQIEAVWSDMPIHAIKCGVLANAEQITAVANWLQQKVVANNANQQQNIPIVIDPVLVATGGGKLTDNTAEALRSLLPLATVVTPNYQEAVALANLPAGLSMSEPSEIVTAILEMGAENVLLTGGDQLDIEDGAGTNIDKKSAHVENIWFQQHEPQVGKSYFWERLPGKFHGSGCTLASTIAAYLAQGCELSKAIESAQRVVHGYLRNAYKVGGGESIPNRLAANPAGADNLDNMIPRPA